MAEYIEREALLLQINLHGTNKFGMLDEDIREFIKKQPAADAVEVVHARFEWGFQNGQYGIWCTNCGAGWVNSENAEWIAQEHNYCPNCGAKMDGVENNQNHG